MNVLKEIILNQLIRIPAVRAKAKKRHETGISHHPELSAEYYSILTKYSSVKGKRMLEIGAGKTTDIILKAKEDGALSVAIVDVETYLTEQQISDNDIDYKVYDGRTIPFPDESFDLIWSSAVYEHIRFPKTTIEETYRLLRPGGMVVHLIDLMDHFSYGTNNREIIFNCLKYPEWLWDMMTWNRSNYVNRLRASEWVDLHKSAGFKIINQSIDTNDYICDNYKTEDKLKYLLKYSDSDAVATGIQLAAEK